VAEGLGRGPAPGVEAAQNCLIVGKPNMPHCLNRFLERNLPPWDAQNLGTLQLGILPATVQLALEARRSNPWAADVPWSVWRDAVLPFASVNEARSDWRRLFRQALAPLVKGAASRRVAVEEVNSKLWSLLRPDSPIVFKSQQTPLIYDPMSTIAYGFASCTGISIVLIDALRSVGVPARLVGTPAWNGDEQAGNHNWVEVWLGGESIEEEGWAFMEGAPAGGGSLTDPCSHWFCNAAKMENGTEVFATAFDREANETVYPMSWDLTNRHVPGVKRTAHYRKVCHSCGR